MKLFKKEIVNPWVFIFSVTAFAIGTSSFLCKCSIWFSVAGIVFADAYLLIALLIAAIRSDEKNWLKSYREKILPTRTVGLLVVTLLVITVILGYANIYFEIGMSEIKSETIPVKFNHVMNNRTDALYFSLVTIVTLGYGDFTPVDKYVKWIVMSEIISAGILFFGAFPLLISRLSDFSTESEKQEQDSKFIKMIEDTITQKVKSNYLNPKQ
jgi:voltage-gated potassium channel Kch